MHRSKNTPSTRRGNHSLKSGIKFFAAIFLGLLLVTKSGLASDPPGLVINSVADFKKDRIAATSIAILPDGSYVASHVLDEGKTKRRRTILFSSSDRGVTWKRIGEHQLQDSSTLFVHQGDLYLMGLKPKTRNIAISRSSDGGKTWTQPLDQLTGQLTSAGDYTTNTVPILVDRGRIYRAYTEQKSGNWKPLVASAPADSDLLNAANWTLSNRIEYKKNQFGGKKELLLCGNILRAPNGSLVNILCATRNGNYAAIAPLNDSGRRLEYDPESAYVSFPFRFPKSTIRFDKESQKYWCIGEKQQSPYAIHNVLCLASSTDLRNWTVETVLLQHVNSETHGFRSADWQFDGDDIVMACATAWGESSSYKQTGHMTFHRFKNFRNLSMANSARLLGPVKNKIHSHNDITIEGCNFEMKKFSNGEPVFANRSYKLKNLPKDFENGWSFTQIHGGNISNLTVEARKGTDLYFATAVTQELIDVTGWTSVPNTEFSYGDRNRTKMQVFKRPVRAGETVPIPSGNWSGGIVLVQGQQR